MPCTACPRALRGLPDREGKSRRLPGPVEAEVTFDCLDAPPELLDLGLKGSGVLELPADTG